MVKPKGSVILEGCVLEYLPRHFERVVYYGQAKKFPKDKLLHLYRDNAVVKNIDQAKSHEIVPHGLGFFITRSSLKST